jgi:FixJ family two-component response regulator
VLNVGFDELAQKSVLLEVTVPEVSGFKVTDRLAEFTHCCPMLCDAFKT